MRSDKYLTGVGLDKSGLKSGVDKSGLNKGLKKWLTFTLLIFILCTTIHPAGAEEAHPGNGGPEENPVLSEGGSLIGLLHT